MILINWSNKFLFLLFASYNGYLDIVNYLISQGANIECQTKDKFTPLHIALHYHHFNIIKYLVSQGANIECQAFDKSTP